MPDRTFEGQDYAAVMQPYFFPYLGYFQLIQRSKIFVILDNVQFIKGGWIHRNKILDKSGRELEISISTSDSSNRRLISSLKIHENFSRLKTLEKIERCYGRAKHYGEAMALIEPLLMFESNSLVEYLENSIKALAQQLGSKTAFIRSSDLIIDDTCSPSGRITEICKRVQVSAYLNLPGGRSIYDSSNFSPEGISLSFFSPELIKYEQFGSSFTASLSILDPLMHAGIEATAEMTQRGWVDAYG